MLTIHLLNGALPPFVPRAFMACTGQSYCCHDIQYSGGLLSAVQLVLRKLSPNTQYETDHFLRSGNGWNFTAIPIPSVCHPVPYLGANKLLFLATKRVKEL
jgi:hypothetical protein